MNTTPPPKLKPGRRPGYLHFGEAMAPPRSVTVFARQVDTLNQLAHRRRTTLSALVREAIDDWIAQHDPPPTHP